MTTDVQNLTDATNALLAQINTSTVTLAAAAPAAAASAAAAAASAAQVGGIARITATGTVTLTTASAAYQFIDPNGANRDVMLPAVNSGDRVIFAIKNNGTANYLTVKNSAGVAQDSPIGATYTLALVWSGTVWEAL